jgi:CO/xanthine dehydrogenase Mo-binding subunit
MTLIGANVGRVDGLAKVTGQAHYTADIDLPGIAYTKALRSPYPHARLLKVDASRAEQHPGVVAIVSRDDLTAVNPYFGPIVEDQPIVGIDRVRYVGEIVAAVAAEEREIAEEAVELIEVEYEPLPAVFDPAEATQPGAPILHQARVETEAAIHKDELRFVSEGNICSVAHAEDGDVNAGFKEADAIFEDTYTLPSVQHGHIEPHTATAVWEPNGKLVVYTANQNPSGLQAQLARIFNLPHTQVRVIVPFVGGGYGGKTHARLEPVVALLSRKARRPVQWVLTRDEVFLTGRRYSAVVKIRTGVKRDGMLVARHVDVFYDIGAYAISGPGHAKSGSYVSSGPYHVPNRSLTAYAVYTNLPPAGPYRGVGVSHVCWACESQMDDIARQLAIDPLEFRLKNLVQEGQIFVTGEKLVSVGISTCLRQVASAIGWEGKDEQAIRKVSDVNVRGKGLAVVIKSTTTPTNSAASVRLNSDGSAVLLTSSVEIGQGSLTSLSQIVGDELGLPLDRVSVTLPDTDVTPYDKSTSSSRTTFHMGNAAKKAAQQIRQQLLEMGANALEASIEDLELKDGFVQVTGVPERRTSISRLLEGHGNMGSLFGSYDFKTAGGLDPLTGKGKAAAFWFFSACGAEVEVDIETGKTRVLRVVASVDVGKAINPRQCHLQNEGSMLAGVGSALFEEMVFDNGQPINGSFLDYMLPSMEDQPREFRSVLVETPHPEGPRGAKGVGEAVLPAIAPAIANAVANALGGVRIKDLPVRPDRIVAKLRNTAEEPR